MKKSGIVNAQKCIVYEVNKSFNQTKNRSEDYLESKFIKSIELINSPIWKRHASWVDPEDKKIFKEIQDIYKDSCAYISNAYLENLSEEYNLYMRSLKYFSGDISESSLKKLASIQFLTKYLAETYKEILWDSDKGIIPQTFSISQIMELEKEYNVAPEKKLLQIIAPKSAFTEEAFEYNNIYRFGKHKPMSINNDPLYLLLFRVRDRGAIVIDSWNI